MQEQWQVVNLYFGAISLKMQLATEKPIFTNYKDIFQENMMLVLEVVAKFPLKPWLSD